MNILRFHPSSLESVYKSSHVGLWQNMHFQYTLQLSVMCRSMYSRVMNLDCWEFYSCKGCSDMNIFKFQLSGKDSQESICNIFLKVTKIYKFTSCFFFFMCVWNIEIFILIINIHFQSTEQFSTVFIVISHTHTHTHTHTIFKII